MANDKEVKSKKDPKNKKSFFKDFKAEIKKVIWPTPKQLINNTIAVVIIVAITATIVFVLDIVFDLLNKYGINKLKVRVRGFDTVQIEDGNVIEDENIISNDVIEENIAEENQTANE